MQMVLSNLHDWEMVCTVVSFWPYDKAPDYNPGFQLKEHFRCLFRAIKEKVSELIKGFATQRKQKQECVVKWWHSEMRLWSKEAAAWAWKKCLMWSLSRAWVGPNTTVFHLLTLHRCAFLSPFWQFCSTILVVCVASRHRRDGQRCTSTL